MRQAPYQQPRRRAGREHYRGGYGIEPYRPEPERPRGPGVFARVRRRRWQLVPLVVGFVAWLAAVGITLRPGGGAAAGAVAGVLLWWWLGRSRLRPKETRYARTVLVVAALWVAVSVWTHLADPRVQVADPVLVLLLGLPWWRHRGVRGRVRVEKTLGDWPDWSQQANASGVRAVSGTAGLVADRIRLELPRGRMRAEEFAGRLQYLAQARGVPEHRLRLDTDITKRDPGLVDLLITHTDPWRDAHGDPVDIPHPLLEDPIGWVERRRTVCEPIPYGADDNGRVSQVVVRNGKGGRLVVLAGKKGSGKTVTLNDVLAGLVPADDVDLVLINIKEGGKSTREWGPAVTRYATTPGEAFKAIRWAQEESARRAEASPDPVMVPTRARKCIGVVIDEYSALVAALPAMGGEVETWAKTMRSASGFLVLADQRPDSGAWSGGLRGQIDTVLCGQMENQRDAKAIFPAWREVDVTVFPEELGGLHARYVGKSQPVSLARSWRLEDFSDIGGFVSLYLSLTDGGWRDSDMSQGGRGGRDSDMSQWRDSDTLGDLGLAEYDGDDAPPPRSSFGEGDMSQDQHPLPGQRGAQGAAHRDKIDSVLEDVAGAAQRDRAAAADLSRAELRRLGADRPAPDSTREELDLDRRILDEIEEAGAAGLSMGELVNILNAPRSTVQARCSAMARQSTPPVHARPPRGRHTRWYWGPPANV